MRLAASQLFDELEPIDELMLTIPALLDVASTVDAIATKNSWFV
jgi:hypothetical protein